MIRILNQIFRTGIVREPVSVAVDPATEQIGLQLEETIRLRFQRSLAIRQVDAGSCNGCELEIHAMNNVFYNCEKYGIHFTASPRFADLLLVTGPLSHNMEIALKRTYTATPTPKIVVAVGESWRTLSRLGSRRCRQWRGPGSACGGD